MEKNIYEQYEVVIGLEAHLQLSTKTKAFCADDISFGQAPNTQISSISLGHPGTLPKLNKEQVEYAIRLGLALDCQISEKSFFDRKNYFYADLPKGYQITQDRMPICIGGGVDFLINGKKKYIRLHHIHMEEDAGKSIHDQDPNFSLIDLNRAGTPLLEIVSEPDFRSADEVAAFMNTIRQLARYLDISDGNMEEGSLRCDCNISVRKKGATEYGERCEVKNMNSMRFAKRAIEYEFKRQIDILENGGKISRQTLNFDPATGVTSPLRDKEDANDYRYFPEPDLPPVVVTKARLEEVRASLPPLPKVLFEQFITEYELNSQDAYTITEEKETALYFIDFAKNVSNKKAAANLLINKIRPYLSEQNLAIQDFKVSFEKLSAFISIIEDGKVSNTMAYQRIFPELVKNENETPLQIAERLNLLQNNDDDFLEKICRDVIAQYPDKVAEYKKGKKGLIGFFMGEVMKQSKGKAEPKSSTALLTQLLSI
jgi:aspartyl-tRNA(Asn)/glutamyl-tRNA(Gln) amidotransferase subunit B